jgi:transposase
MAWFHERSLADLGCRRLLGLAARAEHRPAQVIRIDQLWLRTAPMDMRAGAERLISCVVQTTGVAHARHGDLFANAHATRIELLVHDGFGVWRAARRLNAGHFAWPREAATPLSLTQAQFDTLVVGLPWQRLPEMSVITRI